MKKNPTHNQYTINQFCYDFMFKRQIKQIAAHLPEMNEKAA